jgi:two-component system LytT family response regulator
MNTQPLLNNLHSASTLTTLPLHSIIIPQGNRQIVVPVDQLMCMEGSGNYAFLYTSDGKRYLVSKTLKSYAAMLDQLSFVRIHKSWIINLKYLQGFCECERSVKLHGGREIGISRRRIREVCDILTSLIKSA